MAFSKNLHEAVMGADDLVDLSCTFINSKFYEQLHREELASLAARTFHNATESPLLALPPELRNMIYDYVTSENEYHLVLTKPRTKILERKRAAKKRGASPKSPPQQSARLFSLSSTCRQTDYETKPLPLPNATGQIRNLGAIVYLPSLTPAQLSAITTLRIAFDFGMREDDVRLAHVLPSVKHVIMLYEETEWSICNPTKFQEAVEQDRERLEESGLIAGDVEITVQTTAVRPFNVVGGVDGRTC